MDGGYTGDPFATAIKETLGPTVEIAKRSELHKFAVIPKRWVVERSFAWLEKILLHKIQTLTSLLLKAHSKANSWLQLTKQVVTLEASLDAKQQLIFNTQKSFTKNEKEFLISVKAE